MARGFEVRVANYDEYKNRIQNGFFSSKWIRLPCSEDYISNVFEELGISGYIRYVITEFDTPLPKSFTQDTKYDFQNLDELNYLAGLIDNLSRDDYEKFNLILESGLMLDNPLCSKSPDSCINIIKNLSCYDVLPCGDFYNLVDYYVTELGLSRDDLLKKYWENPNGIEYNEDFEDWYDEDRISKVLKEDYNVVFNNGRYYGNVFIRQTKEWDYKQYETIPSEYQVLSADNYSIGVDLLENDIELHSLYSRYEDYGKVRHMDLYNGNIRDHIQRMKELYNRYPDGFKPSWYNKRDVDLFESRMSMRINMNMPSQPMTPPHISDMLRTPVPPMPQVNNSYLDDEFDMDM